MMTDNTTKKLSELATLVLWQRLITECEYATTNTVICGHYL